MSRKSGNDRPRIATLSSMKESASKPNNGGSDDDDEPRQAFYAGGSDRSGQQVLGPPGSKKDPEKLVRDMFESARKHGGQVVDENESSGPSSSRIQGFSGTGYRLGSEDDPSLPVSNDLNTAMNDIPGLETLEPVNVILRLWSNGFTVDNGPLRGYTDPENNEFLRSISTGEIPRELYALSRGGEVSLNMEDHKTEEYKPVKQTLKAFTGGGQRLGNISPTVAIEDLPVDDEHSKKQNEIAAQEEVGVDESSTVTSIQIRLADGSRLVLRINTTQTVERIRHFIIRARPSYAMAVFKLMTTFPNKELEDDQQTIQEAGLLNACVVQRLV